MFIVNIEWRLIMDGKVYTIGGSENEREVGVLDMSTFSGCAGNGHIQATITGQPDQTHLTFNHTI